ncbi:MAG TPA: DUF2288 family protein [Pelovirga sp.]|nr:DUF2288 family protein [Pelovirga sp.]
MTNLKEDFERDLAQINWRELRIHLRRDAVVTVACDLNLVAVAVAVAADDTQQVQKWIGGGQLAKPTAAELAEWETSLDKAFLMLIVQPYVLIQAV